MDVLIRSLIMLFLVVLGAVPFVVACLIIFFAVVAGLAALTLFAVCYVIYVIFMIFREE